MTTDLVVRGGTVVSSSGRESCDLLITGGRITGRSAPGTGQGDEIVKADGLVVLPGGVDPHVHMMDPGLTEREDFPTGTAAAAVGGVTSIVEHHRSIPFVLDAQTLREKTAYLSERSLIDFALFGGAIQTTSTNSNPCGMRGLLASRHSPATFTASRLCFRAKC